jgi:hypothetical protein
MLEQMREQLTAFHNGLQVGIDGMILTLLMVSRRGAQNLTHSVFMPPQAGMRTPKRVTA